MSQIVIEKDVPIPQYGRSKFPLAQMERGDSFVLPVSQQASIRQAIQFAQRTSAKRFITRTEGDVVRVWRKE